MVQQRKTNNKSIKKVQSDQHKCMQCRYTKEENKKKSADIAAFEGRRKKRALDQMQLTICTHFIMIVNYIHDISIKTDFFF